MRRFILVLAAGCLFIACGPSQPPAPPDPKVLRASQVRTADEEMTKAVLPSGDGTLTADSLLAGTWGPEKGRGPGWLDFSPDGQVTLKAAENAETGSEGRWAVIRGYLVISLLAAASGQMGVPADWKSKTQILRLEPDNESLYSAERLASAEVRIYNQKKIAHPAQPMWQNKPLAPSSLTLVQLRDFTAVDTEPGKSPAAFTLSLYTEYQATHGDDPRIAHVGASYPYLPKGKWLRVLGERKEGGRSWLLVNTKLTTQDQGPEEAWLPASAVVPLGDTDLFESVLSFPEFAYFLLPEVTKKEIDAAQWVVSPMKHRIDGLEAAGKKNTPEYKDLYAQLQKAEDTLLKLDPRVTH